MEIVGTLFGTPTFASRQLFCVFVVIVFFSIFLTVALAGHELS